MDKPTYHGRGPSVPEIVDKIIAQEFLTDQDQTAKEVMNNVHQILQSRGMQLRPDWPGLSYIQKRLTSIRTANTESSPESKRLDQVWSVGSLVEHDIPPEAVPMVVQINEIRPTAPFTIREARWAGRLYKLAKDVNELLLFSVYYAFRERICELTGAPFDTHDVDDVVIKEPVGIIPLVHLYYNLPDFNIKMLRIYIHKLEDMLGIDLDEQGLGDVALSYFMVGLKEYEDDGYLSGEKAPERVLYLREAAQKLAEKYSIGIADIESSLDSIAKELKNERSHS